MYVAVGFSFFPPIDTDIAYVCSSKRPRRIDARRINIKTALLFTKFTPDLPPFLPISLPPPFDSSLGQRI